MKAIICGGRDYILTDEDYADLDELHELIEITEVVSGKARGADTCGERWAQKRGIPVKRVPDHEGRLEAVRYGGGAEKKSPDARLYLARWCLHCLSRSQWHR